MAAVPTGTRRGKRIAGIACALITCTTLIGGCSRVISGTPTTAWQAATDDVAGLPISNTPSGPKNVPAAALRVEGTDNGEIDELARNAIADVQTYWQQRFPGTFDGAEFEPVKRLVSYDASKPGPKICGQDTQGQANAFYCAGEDTVIWDRAEMLPQLDAGFGPLGVVTVLAHELGHAVQERAHTTRPGDSTLVAEQQADCFTGAFFRSAAEGHAEHFQISTGDGLNKVMGALSYIRDTPGGTDFTGTDAHGSAFDRVSAFQDGFSDGPGRCAEIDSADVKTRTTQFRFWKNAQEQDLPVTQRNIEAVGESLEEVFRDTGAKPPRISTQAAACPGIRRTGPAAYCPATNTVTVAPGELQKIAQPPTKDHGGYGDFAAYAELASRYALSVQQATGLPLDDANAGLRTACMVGAWSGLLVEDPIGQRNPVGKLRIAPGDVDEGVAALLGDGSLIAADVNGRPVPAGFARVEAFRTGFQQGMAPCTTKYDAVE